MLIALAQINPTVGDLQANHARIADAIRRAADEGADLVVFPELALTGYPPKDLLLKRQFVDDNLAALHELAARCTDVAALIGHVCRHEGATGRPLHNAAALCHSGRVQATYYKLLLPTYDVFDETRYFEPARSQQIVEFKGLRLGLTICEDIWQFPERAGRPLYQQRPLAELRDANADIVLNISASPYALGKHDVRRQRFAEQCRHYRLPLLYVNQVGGNDELIFDGASCAFDRDGDVIAQAAQFREDLLLVDLDNPESARRETIPAGCQSLHGALKLGLADYARKCGFSSAVLGLSGGIDSAVTAVLAAEVFGPDHVLGIALPSRYSSDHSLADARELAENLGIDFAVVPIEPAHAAFESMLADPFAGREPNEAEENIQARARGVVLMALSNKFGHLLLTTGNKSELAVGYCTLYGDMAGGLAVISDVPKTLVWQLARYLNRDSEIIPESTIAKPPSAELRPDQTDQDSLPPYDVLDAILERYVEHEQSAREIVEAGFDPDIVARVIRLVDRSEYKRKQAAPGLKVTSRAFGFGRRMPIAQNYRPHSH